MTLASLYKRKKALQAVEKTGKDVALLSISDTLSTPMLQQNTNKAPKKLLVIQH